MHLDGYVERSKVGAGEDTLSHVIGDGETPRLQDGELRPIAEAIAELARNVG